jgi:hypothetical protein
VNICDRDHPIPLAEYAWFHDNGMFSLGGDFEAFGKEISERRGFNGEERSKGKVGDCEI